MSCRGRGRRNAKALRWNRTGVHGVHSVPSQKVPMGKVTEGWVQKETSCHCQVLFEEEEAGCMPTGEEMRAECLGAGNKGTLCPWRS